MEARSDVLNKLANAKHLADGLAKGHPNEAPWPTLFALLQYYEGKVHDHWPLTIEEKEACRLGWFSVKNFEEVFPQMDAVLSDLAYSLRHSGG